MPDFSSPARDRTCLLPWEHGVLNTGPPGKSPSSIFPVAACCFPPLTKVCMPLPTTTSTTTCIQTHTEHVYSDEDISNLGHFCSLHIHIPPPTDISLLGHLGNACRWQHISGFFQRESECKGDIPPWGKERLCAERDFEPKDVRWFLSTLEVPRHWKTMVGSPSFVFFAKNNLMLGTIDDPDTNTTGMACLRFICSWVSSWKALLYSRSLESPPKNW